MLYRNTKTGATLETPCRISGGDWKPIKAVNVEKPEKTVSKKKAEGAE